MIELRNINKKFHSKKVIDNYSFKIETGQFVAIVGESGSGKTTLLNIMGLLEKQDSGLLLIDNKEIHKKDILKIQRYDFAYLFQNYGLIENINVFKNLEIALEYKNKKNKKELIKNVLKKVGLENYEKRKIYELSGGEAQRIALARIMLKDSKYIFADEPTGNLDENNSQLVLNILKTLHQENKTIIVVTHDLNLASHADRIININQKS